MPLPATGPIVDQKIPGVPAQGSLDADDVDRLGRIRGAVNGFVRDLPIAGKALAETQEAADAAGWPDRVIEGAVMLAARLWRRRDTPGGVTVLADGGAVYVRRNDPDVALLLELGEHGKPRVG